MRREREREREGGDRGQKDRRGGGGGGGAWMKAFTNRITFVNFARSVEL